MTTAITELPEGLTAPPARGRSKALIGELLVELGFATVSDVESAIGEARASGRATGRVLVENGTITATQLARALALRFGLHHVDLGRFKLDSKAMDLLEPAVARRHGAVPVGFLDGGRTVLIAMADPGDVVAVDDIALITGLEVRPAIATPEEVAMLIARLNRVEEEPEELEGPEGGLGGPLSAGGEGDQVLDLGEQIDEAPVVKLVHSIVAQAAERGASDIHFVPQSGELRIQFRVDGVLQDAQTVPRKMAPHVIARIKIMGDLDISERRKPQDGRFAFTLEGRPIDIRVVTLPLVGGESVVMRILDRGAGSVGLEELGMLEQARSRFEEAISRPYGAVLVTGPTGSGKTTSLYAALRMLNTGERSIITLEDPVEYRLEGIKQMQVNEKAGVTFATGLRSMMRADPDVVMVGEIRDRETAKIAMESALTGHMVLSTLHTNDAPTAITRLIEMEIEPFMVSSAVDCVVAQRLARKLCDHCRREVHLSAELLRNGGFPALHDLTAYEPVGCGRCNGTGYRGRVGIYEVMPITDAIRSDALSRNAANAIAATAVSEGMRRLRDDALEKIQMGLTSVAEAARVTVAS
ncbi:MAG TPA: ATPase, T2SS/T4P/T4SS family [Conexibacter sp.]|nr:ATPase, T2SS/T4P/T4SS family [Conexibacter sp.]